MRDLSGEYISAVTRRRDASVARAVTRSAAAGAERDAEEQRRDQPDGRARRSRG